MQAGSAAPSQGTHHLHSNGLPRFSYRSRGHMVDPTNTRSFKGFLITCPLGREKSATKEAMSLLMGYLCATSSNVCKGITPGNELEQSGDKEIETLKSLGEGSTSDKERSSPSSNQIGHQELHEIDASEEKFNVDNGRGVFFLKMSQKGIVSIFLENTNSDDPVDILSKVLEDILKGANCHLRWCQRMIPIQGTCLLSKESLGPLVVDLVKQHLQGFLPTEEQPLKFAIRYNRRGIATQEEHGSKISQLVLGRMDCIHVVTDAIAEAASHLIAVDLQMPQMVVIVEVIPVVGAHDFPISGVAVVSGGLMNTKPKLCIKPLLSVSHPLQRSEC